MVIRNKWCSAFYWGSAHFYFPDFGAKAFIICASKNESPLSLKTKTAAHFSFTVSLKKNECHNTAIIYL